MSHRVSILLPQIASALRKMARRGAGRDASLSELEARILVELHLLGPLTMTSLVEILGNEKSQVSRTLHGLRAEALIDRETLRAPIVLLAAGAALAQTMVAKAQVDAAKMVVGIGEHEQALLVALFPRLWAAACALLEGESEQQGGNPAPSFARIDNRLMQQMTRIDLLPLRFATLGTLLQRSFFLVCRRAAGLTASETAALIHIWGNAPVHGDEIARLIGRPKAQADRTANRLVQLGLIHRKRALAQHDWVYDVAPAGDDKGAVLQHELARRDAALLAGLALGEATDIKRIIETIHGNIGRAD